MSATAQDVVGVNRTAWAAGGLANKLLSGLIDARAKIMLDSYTMTATEATGSTLKLCANIPNGANVVAIVLYASVAQSSLTVSVGDGASATRYATTNTGLQSAVPSITILPGLNYVVGTTTNDNYLLLTTGGATSTAGIIYAAIIYTMD